MLSNTWDRYRNTFERHRPAILRGTVEKAILFQVEDTKTTTWGERTKRNKMAPQGMTSDSSYLEKLRSQIHKQIEVHAPTEHQVSPDSAYLAKLRAAIHKQIPIEPLPEPQVDLVYLEKIRKQIHKQIEIPSLPGPILSGTQYHQDSTSAADETLFSVASRNDLTTSIGTILSGVSLEELTSRQLDDLAVLVSERGVVFFRGQVSRIEQQVQVFKHYGTINEESTTAASELSRQWRSDASFEELPPSYSFLSVEKSPGSNQETAWTSQYGLYDELSKHMQVFLDSLQAVHTSSTLRLSSNHPATRTHPITELKALNVTPGFVTGFAELKKKESGKRIGT